MRSVVVGPAYATEARARVEVPSRDDVVRIARMRGVPVLENEAEAFVSNLRRVVLRALNEFSRAPVMEVTSDV